MLMPPVMYLHIGLHKTASTFLQNSVFPHLKETVYLQPNRYLKDFFISLVYERLTEKRVNELQGMVSEVAVHEKNLLSNEALSGHPLLRTGKTGEQLLKDLKKVFKAYDVKIILCLREQASWLASVYKEYVRAGGVADFSGFMKSFDELCKHNFGKNMYEAYRYAPYVSLLHKHFGRKNVFVNTFEDFRSDPRAFTKSLASFMGEPETPRIKQQKYYNRGYGEAQIRMARFANRLFKTRMNPKGLIPLKITPAIFGRGIFYRLFPEKFRLPIKWESYLRSRFEKDREELKKKYGISFGG